MIRTAPGRPLLTDFDPAPKTAPAPKIRTLPPSAWAQTWKERPQLPTRVGIRLVGEDVIDAAQTSAAKMAARRFQTVDTSEAHPEGRASFIDLYNNLLIAEVLAHALCNPDDVTQHYFQIAPNDTIRAAMRPETLRLLWEDYELLSIETSPTIIEATDEDIQSLGHLLQLAHTLPGIEPAEARRMRRHLTYVREQLLTMLPDDAISV